MTQAKTYPFLERARKAVLAGLAIVISYGGIAANVLGHSNLSTRDGVIAAVFALATGFGVYHARNAPNR
jgi:hypothetical protein